MEITYRPQNEQPPRKGAWICDRVRFQPGPNQVDAKTYTRLQKLSAFQEAVELGVIVLPVDAIAHTSDPEPKVVEVIDVTKSDSRLSDLSALTIAQAQPLIDKEDDIERLTQWHDADDRVGIKDLIDDRLIDIEPTGFSL
ncbi:MAG: hypothetical protein AAF609_05370 [Cyanobacteria bacterium P01_C01_bin.120]